MTLSPITGVGLSTNDYGDTLQSLGACLDEFEGLGLDSVEITLYNLEVVVGARVAPNRLAQLKAACADRPFRFTIHGPVTSNFMSPADHQRQLDACRATLEVANAIGATAVVTHGGRTGKADLEDGKKRERTALRILAPEAEASGATLCVETVFTRSGLLAYSPADLAEQLAAVNSPAIRATIDFSHSAINAAIRGYDLLESLRALAPYAGHLNLHNSFGLPARPQRSSRMERTMFGEGDLHLPLGWGDLPWETFAALPFTGPMVANLELMRRHGPERADSIARARAFMAAVNQAKTAATS